MPADFIIYNGVAQSKERFTIDLNNRSFRYGDAVFESMFATNIEIPFFELHFSRLILAMRSLKFEQVDYFQDSENRIYAEIKRLLQQNKLYKGVRVRLTVFRKSGGLYTPTTNLFDYLIETEKLPYHNFEINQQGYIVGPYIEDFLDWNKFSFFKSANALPFVMAGIFAKEKKWNDCVLFNPKYNIVESMSSNVFVVNNGVYMTPEITSGCVDGVMRQTIIRLLRENKKVVFDDVTLEEVDLLSADEFFLTNAVGGIKWVVAYKRKRFYNRSSLILTDWLRTDVKKKIEALKLSV